MTYGTRRRLATVIIAPVAALATWALISLIGIDLILSHRHEGSTVGPVDVFVAALAGALAAWLGRPLDRTPQPAPSKVVGAGRLDSARHIDHRAQLARRRLHCRCTYQPARGDGRRCDRRLRPHPARARRRLPEARATVAATCSSMMFVVSPRVG